MVKGEDTRKKVTVFRYATTKKKDNFSSKNAPDRNKTFIGCNRINTTFPFSAVLRRPYSARSWVVPR